MSEEPLNKPAHPEAIRFGQVLRGADFTRRGSSEIWRRTQGTHAKPVKFIGGHLDCYGGAERYVSVDEMVCLYAAPAAAKELTPLFLSRDREKMIESIIHLCRLPSGLLEVDLHRRLFVLDAEKYSFTGRTVTGLAYHAWKSGPVAMQLKKEIEAPGADLASCIRITGDNQTALTVSVLPSSRQMNPEHFSRREITLLQHVSSNFEPSDQESPSYGEFLGVRPYSTAFVRGASEPNLIDFDKFADEPSDSVRTLLKNGGGFPAPAPLAGSSIRKRVMA